MMLLRNKLFGNVSQGQNDIKFLYDPLRVLPERHYLHEIGSPWWGPNFNLEHRINPRFNSAEFIGKLMQGIQWWRFSNQLHSMYSSVADNFLKKRNLSVHQNENRKLSVHWVNIMYLEYTPMVWNHPP